MIVWGHLKYLWPREFYQNYSLGTLRRALKYLSEFSITMKNISAAVGALSIAIVGAWQIQAQNAPVKTPASLCLSRLQQSALALSVYARDYDERFPPADAWNDALSPLLPKPVAATKMTNADMASPFDCPILGAGEWGYSMNWKLSKRRLNELDSPRTTVSLYETNVPRPNANYDGRDLIFRHTQIDAAGKSESGGNFAFADGHVGWVPATQGPNFRIFLDNKPRKPN